MLNFNAVSIEEHTFAAHQFDAVALELSQQIPVLRRDHLIDAMQ